MIPFAHRSGLAAILFALLAAPGVRAQPVTSSIKGAPSCSGCSIRLERLVTLSAGDDSMHVSGPRGAVTPVRDASGRFVTVVDAGVSIGVFDSTGVLRFLTAGSSRNIVELGGITGMAAVAGDTIYVAGSRRLLVLGPDLRVVRSVELPAFSSFAGALNDGRFAVTMPLSVTNKSMPAQLLGPDGAVIREFGSVDSLPVSGCTVCDIRNVDISLDHSSFLVSHRNEYVLERWNRDGEVTGIVRVLDSPWFEAWLALPEDPNPLTMRPRSMITAVEEDSLQRLWVYAANAPTSWKPWAGPPSQAIRVIGSTVSIRPEQLTEEERAYLAGNTATVIEVLDPRSGQVLVGTIFDHVKLFPLAPGIAYGERFDANGFAVIDIYRLSIAGLPPG